MRYRSRLRSRIIVSFFLLGFGLTGLFAVATVLLRERLEAFCRQFLHDHATEPFAQHVRHRRRRRGDVGRERYALVVREVEQQARLAIQREQGVAGLRPQVLPQAARQRLAAGDRGRQRRRFAIDGVRRCGWQPLPMIRCGHGHAGHAVIPASRHRRREYTVCDVRYANPCT